MIPVLGLQTEHQIIKHEATDPILLRDRLNTKRVSHQGAHQRSDQGIIGVRKLLVSNKNKSLEDMNRKTKGMV